MLSLKCDFANHAARSEDVCVCVCVYFDKWCIIEQIRFLDLQSSFKSNSKNKAEVHAKMLWASIENIFNRIQETDRNSGSAFFPDYLHGLLFYGGETIDIS